MLTLDQVHNARTPTSKLSYESTVGYRPILRSQLGPQKAEHRAERAPFELDGFGLRVNLTP